MSNDEIELDPSAASKPLAASAVETAALEASTAAEAAAASAGVNIDAELATALASGRVDATGARELLIEQVLSEQLGALDAAERARIEAELATLLEADPTLDALLRP